METYNEIKKVALSGQDVYPFMFQPIIGRSNKVSAAIRKLKEEGVIEVAGKDGTGRPFYRKAGDKNPQSPWFVQ